MYLKNDDWYAWDYKIFLDECHDRYSFLWHRDYIIDHINVFVEDV